jgi:soluble lytic murein transglycosylase
MGARAAASIAAEGDAAPDGPRADEHRADEGMPAISVVLDDVRLARARERARAQDDSGAAREIDAARASTSLGEHEACAWAYVAGRFHLAAGENADAAAAFDRAAAPGDDAGAPCTLAAYASLRAAEAYVRAARLDEAIVRARAVPDDFALHDEAKLALADALSAKGDRTAAVAVWRALLASSPRGLRWADSAARLAAALLDGVDGPPESRAKEAYDLATRLLVEAPKAADGAGAQALRDHAVALGRVAGLSHALSPDERARRAQSWLDAGEPTHAADEADALLASLKKTSAHKDAACKVAIVRAQASPRGKAVATADAWGDAIKRCDGDDALVTPLYFGGKASASAHRQDEALARFSRVELLFAKHRYADDARFHAAAIVLDQGDEQRWAQMLLTLPDAYPDGDLRTEAIFRVALARFAKGDLDGAKPLLDRILALEPNDRGWATAGRAAYFRARIAERAGDRDDAKKRYATILSEQPLAYYMLLSHARLAALDGALARSTVESSIAHEPSVPFLTHDHDELRSPGFDRFVRLLEVGETDAARHEASFSGLTSDKVDPEVLWTLGWLYERAGSPDLGHAFTRARLADFHAHWPAGRWRLAWEIAFPRAFEPAVVKESETTRIPAPLTWAVMREESAFNPDARSGSNAIGLMQLLLGTAREVAKGTTMSVDERALRRPEVSIALGARLLASLRGGFSSNPALAIAAYNSGSGAVRRWLAARGADDFDVWVEQIPYDETRGYLKRVLASEAAYAFLYARPALDDLLLLPVRATGG